MISQILVFLTGISIGSFANVLITRLPGLLIEQYDHAERFNPITASWHICQGLASPSHCCHCRQRLGIVELIPILGYLLLAGRCRHCQRRIPVHHPLIEFLVGIAALFCFYSYSAKVQAILIFLFIVLLLVDALIDWQRQILPEGLNIAGLWLGLLYHCLNGGGMLVEAVLGVIAGYGLLYLIAQGYYAICKREGLGFGDLKMVAMLGAWLGIFKIPLLLAIAAGCASLYALYGYCLHHQRNRRIPFAPFLSISALVVLLQPIIAN